MSDQLNFSYDLEKDVLEIEGVKYSGELFRQLSPKGMRTGTLFEFVRRDGGDITINRIWAPEEKRPA